MGISKKDEEIIEWLYKMDRKTLGEDVCKNGHYFPKGKYPYCPICGSKFKTESKIEQELNYTDNDARNISRKREKQ